MADRLKKYIEYYESLEIGENDDKEKIRVEMLTQINFFMHERLIHLIVTVTFALLEMISIVAIFFVKEIFMFAIMFLFFVLLVPYIFHYYKLENGVQKLYEHYDRLFVNEGKH